MLRLNSEGTRNSQVAAIFVSCKASERIIRGGGHFVPFCGDTLLVREIEFEIEFAIDQVVEEANPAARFGR